MHRWCCRRYEAVSEQAASTFWIFYLQERKLQGQSLEQGSPPSGKKPKFFRQWKFRIYLCTILVKLDQSETRLWEILFRLFSEPSRVPSCLTRRSSCCQWPSTAVLSVPALYVHLMHMAHATPAVYPALARSSMWQFTFLNFFTFFCLNLHHWKICNHLASVSFSTFSMSMRQIRT